MTLPRSRPSRDLVARLIGDQQGFILVFFAVAIPALLGLIGLALDGTRLLTLDSELANQADAAALAAASRLDRTDGAIAAARRAAAAVVDGPGRDVSGLSFRFAASLDELRGGSTYTLADTAGADASVVEVRTAAATLTVSFLQLVGAYPVPLRQRAVAESRYYACDVTPLALCQPDPQAFVASARPGRQYFVRLDGGMAAGSVAVLDRPDVPDDRQALVAIASDRPAFCYADHVRRRGNVAPDEFDEAVNVRFDRYTGRNGPIRADLVTFPPAPVVVAGRHLDTCRSPPQGGDLNPPFPIPRDTAFHGIRPTAPWNGGAGDWKAAPPLGGTGVPVRTAFDEYVLWNHAEQGIAVGDRLRGAGTRWELYLAELGLTPATETQPVDTRSLGTSVASVPSGGPSIGPFSLRRENPVPVCYAGTRAANSARRRILYMTVLDCGGLGTNGRAEELSRRVAKFFLTEPSDAGAMLVEFVGFLQPAADDGKLRHVVQLVDAD